MKFNVTSILLAFFLLSFNQYALAEKDYSLKSSEKEFLENYNGVWSYQTDRYPFEYRSLMWWYEDVTRSVFVKDGYSCLYLTVPDHYYIRNERLPVNQYDYTDDTLIGQITIKNSSTNKDYYRLGFYLPSGNFVQFSFVKDIYLHDLEKELKECGEFRKVKRVMNAAEPHLGDALEAVFGGSYRDKVAFYGNENIGFGWFALDFAIDNVKHKSFFLQSRKIDSVCPPCGVDINVVTYTNTNGNWKLASKQSMIDRAGAYGEASRETPSLIAISDNKVIARINSSYGGMGGFIDYDEFYLYNNNKWKPIGDIVINESNEVRYYNGESSIVTHVKSNGKLRFLASKTNELPDILLERTGKVYDSSRTSSYEVVYAKDGIFKYNGNEYEEQKDGTQGGKHIDPVFSIDKSNSGIYTPSRSAPNKDYSAIIRRARSDASVLKETGREHTYNLLIAVGGGDTLCTIDLNENPKATIIINNTTADFSYAGVAAVIKSGNLINNVDIQMHGILGSTRLLFERNAHLGELPDVCMDMLYKGEWAANPGKPPIIGGAQK